MSDAPQDARPTGAAPLAPSAPAPTPASAGAMLRELRESAGVDAGVLASAMKVSLQKLDALEHDRFDQLPDLTFARALASAICRAFGVDPAPVLARMPAIAADLRPPTSGDVNAPFRAGDGAGAAPWSGAFSRPLVAVIAVLLLGAALLWLWPTWPIHLNAPEPTTEPAAAPGGAVEAAAASEPVPAEAPQPPASVALDAPLAPAPSAPPTSVGAAALPRWLTPRRLDRLEQVAIVLLWALGLVEELSWPDKVCDVAHCVSLLVNVNADADALVQDSMLRSPAEILEQLDLHLRLHWLLRDAELHGKPAPDVSRGVVMERHHALNWLINFEGAPWDTVSTAT